MPKARMTDEEREERAFYRAYARAKVDLGLDYEQDVAKKLGIKRSTLSKRKPDLYGGFGFRRAKTLVKALQITDRELCEMFGVRYNPNRDSDDDD